MDIERGRHILIFDLGCGGARATTLERELAATDTAYVDYDPSETDPWALARAVERAGYRAGRPVEA